MRVVMWPARAGRDLNPFTSLLVEELERLGVEVSDFDGVFGSEIRRLLRGKGPDILHFHWPSFATMGREAYAWPRAAALLAELGIGRLTGTRLVWTVHNLQPHETLHPRLESWYWHWFIRAVDGYIALTPGGERAALEEFPRLRGRPSAVIPHGHYRGVYPNSITRDEARARLDIEPEANVFCFLGQIRRYKNVPHLIDVFSRLDDPQALLVVAGAPDAQVLEGEIRSRAERDPRVRLHLGFVPNEELQLYLNAADVMVMPYQEILNSGGLLLALSFDRPALVPARGAMDELREQFGERWVRTYGGELDASELAAAMRWAREEPRGRADLSSAEWPSIGEATLAFYERVMAR